MPLHLYCIVPAGAAAPPAGPVGVDGHQVRAVTEGALDAWISEGAGGGPDVDRMEAHDRVVRTALAEVTPLPVRYGQPVADEAAVRERIREHAGDYDAALARVAGCVEMAVRLPLPEAAGSSDSTRGHGPVARTDGETRSPGRQYLEGRREALARANAGAAAADEMEDRVAETLGPLVREARSLITAGSGGTVLALAHLVLRTDMQAYREAVAGLAGNGVPLTASGPWAPYSFV